MKNTTKTKLWAALWVIVGLVLVAIPFILDYCFRSDPETSNNLFILLANNVCPALATIAILSFAWEMITKRSFAKEVLELSNVSNNYIDSGIIHVYSEFTEINWISLFQDAKKVVLFFTYAYSWRSNNRTAIEMLKQQNTEITVILPNYNSDDIINSLNRDFKYADYAEVGSENGSKNARDFIKETEVYFKNLGANVKLYSGDIKSTYYFIDDKCVFAPFKHGSKKSSVPAILCQKGGTLFSFCERDINAIIDESR